MEASWQQGLCHSTFLRCWVHLWSMFYYECSVKVNVDAWHFSHIEKWKKVKVAQLCPTLCEPMDCTVHRILQARILEWVATGDLANQGSNSPALQVDSLPAEPQRKRKNTGVGSLSLLQWIFPTQEWNWGLLHCRWILYQLSYEGRLTCIKSLNPHNNTRR